ncbi:cytochrome c-type biogenesis protein [Anaerobacterium chartisolvens]|uniref:Cytochrome c-type biogenesis protein n=1 Tax=Anaerobacterium chartisolvens TaxID=1297424 RepID=A0A369BGH0_9FIRM|nr:cytochrome c biogenesis protein CcdA [Anaerobacterium chartisolvens]RCX18784.1 cytochrome c-type biogenesis protein [Anaerobacterium chartisolvens]
MDSFSYLLTFIEGILTFISPCILPMLPVYFSYLAGSSNAASGEGSLDKKRVLLNSIGFVIGFTIIFIALGAAATSLGHFLKDHAEVFRRASGILMIIFGVNFTGLFKIGFLNRERRFEFKFDRLKFLSSIIFGMVFGFGWTPCLGAFLGSALGMAANSGTMAEGVMLLFTYSIGLGMPFVVSALLFERIKSALKEIQKHSRAVSIVSGIILIAAGILVYTDKIKYLGNI